MGREVRRVPADWQHPQDQNGQFVPLMYGYNAEAERYQKEKEGWESGDFPSYATAESRFMTYEEWAGEAPRQSDYMPDFDASVATHWQMYETTSEGTPISPVFASPEELALWLFENNASAFGNTTATFEEWLAMIHTTFSPSCVLTNNQIKSGVGTMSSTSFIEAELSAPQRKVYAWIKAFILDLSYNYELPPSTFLLTANKILLMIWSGGGAVLTITIPEKGGVSLDVVGVNHHQTAQEMNEIRADLSFWLGFVKARGQR